MEIYNTHSKVDNYAFASKYYELFAFLSDDFQFRFSEASYLNAIYVYSLG